MIYPHQAAAIEYITEKFRADPSVDALLLSGSISHGYNLESSDVDLNIVVPREIYDQRVREQKLTYWEACEPPYPGGYYDGKFITLDYLRMVIERGNEPTRFALHDVKIAFDRTGRVADLIERIGQYDARGEQERAVRFLAQLIGWKWYCEEALKRQNKYLLDLSAAKLILFAGRLVLLHNRIFFPYHKWFLRALADAPDKPPEFMALISRLLDDKSPANIDALYNAVTEFKDWAGGQPFDWGTLFIRDVETVWMREDEMVDNM